MRLEALERLRMTLHGCATPKPSERLGTLEPAAFQPSVPSRSSSAFQVETPGVPAVPTVPTSFVGARTERPIPVSSESERRLERCRNGLAQGAAFQPEALKSPADRRNRAAVAAGCTDRFCACGKLAAVAIGRFPASQSNPEGVTRWVCSECFEPRSAEPVADGSKWQSR